MKSKTHSLTLLPRSARGFFALAAGVSLALLGSARAADPAPEVATAAKRLMDVMKVKEQFGPMLESVTQAQEAMIQQQNLTEEQAKVARAAMEASLGEVKKALAWETIEPMLVGIYAGVFTAAELNRLADFFESPEGKVYVEKQPAVQAATMAEMQKVMVGLMPAIQQKTKAAIEKAKSE
ncbi:MAG: DUF2059 domain-containing protein [Verrucomicrobiae bacterium]|nr:DUF2059 domain-containing protein [Verrucomicrobiae bacterium]MCP5541888.1 DUF2059 domain-containing protein [Akkermansiaceae bacterium]